jgi:Na+/proline symporter
MKLGTIEIIVIILAFFSLISGLAVFILGATVIPGLYNPEYVEAHRAELTEPWMWMGIIVVIGGWLLTFFAWAMMKYLAEDFGQKNLAKDEREKMMRTRAMMASYSIFLLVFIIVTLYEYITDGPAKEVTYWLMIFAVMLNGVSLAVSKYILR